MIGWEDVYKVVVAMTPLYVALMLGYGSVKWWRVFTREHGDAVSRFVCFFTLPLFTFEFTANADPFKWNYMFIAADAISKFIIVVLLALWTKFSSKGSYSWSITSFSLCTLTNSLVVGVPLMKAMYGQMAVDLVVQSSIVQAIIWLTVLLFVLEFRRTGIDYSAEAAGETGKDLEGSAAEVAASASGPSFWYLMRTVWLKLAMNPNSYACIIGITWAFIANRYVHKKYYIDRKVDVLYIENMHGEPCMHACVKLMDELINGCFWFEMFAGGIFRCRASWRDLY
jgi:auxin efflux carrier family